MRNMGRVGSAVSAAISRRLGRQDKSRALPTAIVLALDTMQGLQTARILDRHGVPVVGFVSDPTHHTTRTRACVRVESVDKQADLLKRLVEIGQSLPEKGVLVPCSDARVLMVARHREILEPFFHIPLASTDTVELLMMKDAFYRFAIAEGFPIPPTWMMSDGHDIELVAEQVPYPAVLKPIYRSKNWTANTSEKAFKVETPGQLVELYRKAAGWSDDLIVQQWIPGGVEDLYSCNCYIGRDGEVLATFVARKLRQWPPETGQSSLGEECRNDTVMKETVRLFEAVGYHGLGYVEMKRDPDSGSHYIVEPNIGRPTGRSAIAEAGGVELLWTMYCDAAGLPLPEERFQRYTGVKWIHLRRDLQSAITLARRGDLSFGDWWKSFRGPKAYAVWSLTDPVPFFLDIREAFGKRRSGTGR